MLGALGLIAQGRTGDRLEANANQATEKPGLKSSISGRELNDEPHEKGTL